MFSKRWTLSEMKEILLALLAMVWGIGFLFPGNVLSPGSRLTLLSLYASDWVWGVLLITTSSLVLFLPRTRWLHYRKNLHLFFWLFWFGITVLTIVRSSANGLGITDVLIASPFLTIALLHVTLYARLASVE